MRNTKIVATLGPASDSPETLRKLFLAGVNVFRLNASHGDQASHAERIKNVRELAREMNVHAGILLDLQGPKIRLGTFLNGGGMLEEGHKFVITAQAVDGTVERASVSYADFAKDVKPGDKVLIADGSVELKVLDTDGISATCVVVSGGPVSDRKGINLPGAELRIPSLTKKDISDLRFGLQQGVDFLALSFVRKRDDVLRLRVYLEENDVSVPIVAKIEKPDAVKNLEAILQESDGVMVARGDLGVEMALERVPAIQKNIIERARQHGKFVITATQMLESMVENPFPTRAEVSDVANAIYDGTDAVMLSAETSTGKHPVEAVRMMARIAEEAEKSRHGFPHKDITHREKPSFAEIVADAAFHASRVSEAVGIVVMTASGATARLLAKFRPHVPVFTFTGSEIVARQLAVIHGVQPYVTPQLESTDEMLVQVDHVLLEQSVLKQRDPVVFVAGQPMGRPGTTNLLKLHLVGELH